MKIAKYVTFAIGASLAVMTVVVMAESVLSATTTDIYPAKKATVEIMKVSERAPQTSAVPRLRMSKTKPLARPDDLVAKYIASQVATIEKDATAEEILRLLNLN